MQGRKPERSCTRIKGSIIVKWKRELSIIAQKSNGKLILGIKIEAQRNDKSDFLRLYLFGHLSSSTCCYCKITDQLAGFTSFVFFHIYFMKILNSVSDSPRARFTMAANNSFLSFASHGSCWGFRRPKPSGMSPVGDGSCR